MIKLELDEIVMAYFGFMLPLYLMLTPEEVSKIAFLIFIWCLNCWIWTNWKR